MNGDSRLGLAIALNLLIMSACMGSFMWGAARYFRRVRGVPLAMSLTSIFTVAAFLWLVVRLGLGFRSSWWGVSIVVETAAALLFWWSVQATNEHRLTLAFSEDLPSRLITVGPYRYVRHPFYSSYIVFWVAASANVVGVVHWLIPLIAAPLYFYAAMQEEGKFARSDLANDYDAYRSRTGMVLPKLLR